MFCLNAGAYSVETQEESVHGTPGNAGSNPAASTKKG